MVDKKVYLKHICPNCGYNSSTKELDEVYVCQSCGTKFNVHQKENFSPKYILFSIFFIALLMLFLKWSIKPFDREKAMQEIYEKYQKKDEIVIEKNNQTIHANAEVIASTNKYLWKLYKNNLPTLLIEKYKLDTKEPFSQINLNVEADTDLNQLSTYFLLDKLLIYANDFFYIVNIESNQISVSHDKLLQQHTILKNAIQRIEYLQNLNALTFKNLDGNMFYYFIEKNKLLSEIEFQQVRKNEQNSQLWSFENQYVIANSQLFKILKKKQEYAMPVAANDIQSILEGNTWLKNVYQITSISKVNLPFQLDNLTQILFQNENEILFFEENKNNILYYNINNNLYWNRLIEVPQLAKISGYINNEIVIFHQKNAYIFNKKNGEIILKY